MLKVLGCSGALVLLWPALTAAQPAPVPGKFFAVVGVRWTGETTIGSMDATETTPAGGRFQLFSTSTTLAPAAGLDVGTGVRLARSIEAELSSSYSKPELRTRVSADAEGASGLTATELVKQVTVEGSLTIHLTRLGIGRATPFVSAGGGFLRFLHAGNTLAENGRVYHAGAGLHYWMRRSARGGLGIRLDGRAMWRSGGTVFEENRHVSPAAAASLFARF